MLSGVAVFTPVDVILLVVLSNNLSLALVPAMEYSSSVVPQVAAAAITNTSSVGSLKTFSSISSSDKCIILNALKEAVTNNFSIIVCSLDITQLAKTSFGAICVPKFLLSN